MNVSSQTCSPHNSSREGSVQLCLFSQCKSANIRSDTVYLVTNVKPWSKIYLACLYRNNISLALQMPAGAFCSCVAILYLPTRGCRKPNTFLRTSNCGIDVAFMPQLFLQRVSEFLVLMLVCGKPLALSKAQVYMSSTLNPIFPCLLKCQPCHTMAKGVDCTTGRFTVRMIYVCLKVLINLFFFSVIP